MKIKHLIGIDEVGRGPLAGPLTLGMVVLTDKDFKKVQSLPLKDSKKLTHEKRVETVKFLKENKIKFYTTSVSSKDIDKSGISRCIKKAISRLLKDYSERNTFVKLDGLLKAPERFKFQETIVKGDEKEIIIALASVVAKVRRDRYMIKISSKYPKYFFDSNKGYGTLVHRKAIKKYGMSDIHRISFCKNI